MRFMLCPKCCLGNKGPNTSTVVAITPSIKMMMMMMMMLLAVVVVVLVLVLVVVLVVVVVRTTRMTTTMIMAMTMVMAMITPGLICDIHHVNCRKYIEMLSTHFHIGYMQFVRSWWKRCTSGLTNCHSFQHAFRIQGFDSSWLFVDGHPAEGRL